MQLELYLAFSMIRNCMLRKMKCMTDQAIFKVKLIVLHGKFDYVDIIFFVNKMLKP